LVIKYKLSGKNIGKTKVYHKLIMLLLLTACSSCKPKPTHPSYDFYQNPAPLFPLTFDAGTTQTPPTFSPIDPPDTAGVYAIECVNGYVKIGRARSISQRMHELQTGCPFELKLLAILSTDPNDESAFHKRFAADRRHGEWFVMSPGIQKAIEEKR
jgi:hypothetical protein